ncbi:16S rRNA (cytosine967-C5)-methyltransferase [Lachnospiraceae bacterium]|nr:16S rRNA (cytosine967-C5)-methyltransferase [Lachnospiraceae bacterium]
MDIRETAYDILKKIEYEDLYVNDILHNALRRMQFSDKRDRAFLTRLVEGVTERRISLDHLIDKLSTGKKKLKPDIRILLRMGIYQIRYMEAVPDRAAISETVELVKRSGYAGLSGFVNALLRKVSELSAEGKLDSFLVSRMDTRYSTPKWLCDLLVETYGKENAKLILTDQYKEHDTVIRSNLQKTSIEELKERLISKGLEVSGSNLKLEPEQKNELDKRVLRIANYDSVPRLPGFRDGHFIIQDETSVHTILRAGIKPGDLVLDMCAAPGGKSLLAYELTANDEKCGLIISRDISEDKIDKIRENAERLGVPVSDGDIPAGIKLEIKDATELDGEFAKRPSDKKADVVLVDVPCSGLGIIGRKNDIKYHTSPEAMKELAEQGLRILKNASHYVKQGGRICFSTCTINPGENQDVVRAFLESDEGNRFEIREERTFLQGIDGSDGFYYCIFF